MVGVEGAEGEDSTAVDPHEVVTEWAVDNSKGGEEAAMEMGGSRVVGGSRIPHRISGYISRN